MINIIDHFMEAFDSFTQNRSSGFYPFFAVGVVFAFLFMPVGVFCAEGEPVEAEVP